MATLKLLFISATLLVCGVASVDKRTAPVAPSSTVHHVMPTTKGPTPTSSPKPKPQATAQYNYTNGNASFPCRIRMDGVMAWNFTYNTTKDTTKSVTELVNGTATVVNDKSSCIYRESAKLVLEWEEKNEPRDLTFEFKAGNTKRNMHWELENVTLNFTIKFPDYPSSDYSTNGTLYFENFIDKTNNEVEYQRSYLCNTLRKLDFKPMTNASLNVSVNITNFRIQAFDFKEPHSTKSAYGNARVCPVDATGKTIVPIAVGIALGVLVIAVIVAFIISKIVNRKKSGYEALN